MAVVVARYTFVDGEKIKVVARAPSSRPDVLADLHATAVATFRDIHREVRVVSVDDDDEVADIAAAFKEITAREEPDAE